ncbi:SDR family NAD(P)-dependent oxidoreductase [Rhodococcus sp. IEGM1428]|uniref:SDR family NAD(P)-dependent oxidoreductase n=1 Tax=Rhodococcus sp. IEGM1428 TaxID=3392191 RepID=UPI003D143BBE
MIDPAHYGPWAVIAGGSEGVGREFAVALSKVGINLVLLARNPGPLQETAELARANDVDVRTLPVDLLESGARDRIRSVTDDLEVGLLIFNAGASTYGTDFVTGDLDKLRDVVALNVTKQMDLTHHFGSAMRDRRRGGIILIGSLSGYVGAETLSVYSAAKAFSRVFAEGLWLELAPFDVHVLELVLGATRTPAMARAGLNFDLPALRVAEPEDVVREGLENLENGPVWVAAGHYAQAQAQCAFPRAAIVRAASATTKEIMSG